MTKKSTTAIPIEIQSVRLSFIWAEVLPDFLQRNAPAGSPFEPFTRDYLFAEMFESARNGARANPTFDVPWLRERRQIFWMRYLVQGKLSMVPGSQAWTYQVPLRFDTGIRPRADWFTGDAFIDAFYYPFGTAVAISFRWTPSASLEALVDQAYDIRNGKFSIANGAQQLRLEELADTAFAVLRERALGPQALGDCRSADPFTIFTVVQAKGVDSKAPVRANTAVMEALEALTSWPPTPHTINLPDLNRACLETYHHSPQAAALYASRRGRAAWVPALFSVEQPRKPAGAVARVELSSKLSCYHRNLMFASMQIESLGRLLSHTARLFAQGKQKTSLTANHRDLAMNAAVQLAKLYRGARADTWRSESARRQIEENGLADLQSVLAQFPEAQKESTAVKDVLTMPGTSASSAAKP